MNRVAKYVLGALGYGLVRGVYYTENLRSRENERMLFGTKLGYIIMCTGMAPIFTPYYLLLDLNHADERFILKKRTTDTDEVFPFPGFRLGKDFGK